MPSLRLWLLPPLSTEPEYRNQIAQACPNVAFVPVDTDVLDVPPELDGRGINALVCEIPPRNLSDWPDLRLIQLVSAGVDPLKGHPVWKSGIPVATARGTHSVPIAEHVTAMLLMLAHRIPETMRFGETWQWPNRDALAGGYLRGKTVGIIGYGGIGAECGRQLSLLGMRVLALNRYGKKLQTELPPCWEGTGDLIGKYPDRFFATEELSQMLPQCDALVVTAAKTDSTKGLIGQNEIELLPDGARIVVASRGGIVEEVALAEALRSGKLAGAAVDAFEQEPPPPDHPLRGAPNLVATPHMSGVFTDFWSKISAVVGENIRRLSQNEPLVNLVNV